MTSLAALSLDELADGICLRAGRIAAAQAELLTWIAEFDRREGWAGPGMLSCAHWLSWRIGMTLGTARDQVRVARRLEDLPAVAAAFTDGRVSYSKVRAITRVAQPDDGIDWVELARHSSAAQLDRIVRGVGRAHANELAERDPQAAAWRLRTRTRYDDNGNFILTISGPAQLLPVIRAGLDAKKQQLRHEAEAEVAPATPTPGHRPRHRHRRRPRHHDACRVHLRGSACACCRHRPAGHQHEGHQQHRRQTPAPTTPPRRTPADRPTSVTSTTRHPAIRPGRPAARSWQRWTA